MKPVRFAVIVLLAAVWLGPRDGESCGPFLPEAEFAPERGPLDPAQYARGDLGVVRPTFRTRDLFVAWRALTGVPLNPQEAAAIYPQPSNGPYVSPATVWLDARKQVQGMAPPPNFIGTERRSLDPKDYFYFPNCLDDAFAAAAARLQSLAARWGASSVPVRQWAAAQDQVFDNCTAGPNIPAPLPAGTDADLAAERAYQIAAAEFYAGRFDAAERDFGALTANPAAPYLVARSMIREATLRKDPARLRAAADQLNAVVAGSGPGRWKDAARSLLGYIQSRLEPQAHLKEISTEMVKPGLGPKLGPAFGDFLYLWNLRDPKSPPGTEFEDWLATFPAGDAKHAVERWGDEHSAPWLIAALALSAPAGADAAELTADARKVPAGDPAWPSATYYGIRMERLGGDADGARQWADEALAVPQSESTRNLLRAERLAVARDWTEFLQYATRRPVAIDYGDGTPDQPFGPRTPRKPVAFDNDSVAPMNRMVPLKLWAGAASSAAIPPDLQADIAQAGWVRALVLHDRDAARGFATRVIDLRPELAGGMRSYLAGSDPDAAQFTAVFLMLRNPGFSPELHSGLGRLTPVSKLDEYRDNWWTLRPPASPVAAPFLSDEERAEGSRQADDLGKAAANSVNYLCAAAIGWAEAHPRDPRVPEALYLAVRATRYGNSADKSSSPLSKQAFDLLHRRYPDSPWTTQTKYWY